MAAWALTHLDEPVVDAAVEAGVPVPRLLSEDDGLLWRVLREGDQPQGGTELRRVVVHVQHGDVNLAVAWTRGRNWLVDAAE